MESLGRLTYKADLMMAGNETSETLEVEEVLQVSWTYTLYRHEERFFLSVVCGTVGLFETDVELTSAEIADYRKLGKESVDALAKAISDAPKAYNDRHIKTFFKWPKTSPSSPDEA